MVQKKRKHSGLLLEGTFYTHDTLIRTQSKNQVTLKDVDRVTFDFTSLWLCGSGNNINSNMKSTQTGEKTLN